jgi:dCTP deaminase
MDREMAKKVDRAFQANSEEGRHILRRSAYGYDIRIADEYKVPKPQPGKIIDPKNFDEDNFIHLKTDVCKMPANSYVICRSFEYLRIPRDILVICFGKSTYARSGVVVNITPLEPEWEGYITISISNTSPFPVRLYAHEGLAQLVFLGADESGMTSHAGTRRGKYPAPKRHQSRAVAGDNHGN